MQLELERLADPKAAPEKIAGGFTFTEGPVFSRLGYLLFTDIPANRIHKWEHGKLTVFRENTNGANGLTFDHQGRLLACERGQVTRTEKDGSLTILARSFEGKLLNRPNDIVYAIDGSIYFTDLIGGNAAAKPGYMPFSAIYQLTRKGELRLATRDCPGPNGVALAPDQQKLYVADTRALHLRVFDIAADGALRNGRVFAENVRGDGLKTDEEGNVWTVDSPGLSVFHKDGRKLGTFALPEPPANCAWGEGFHDLYITARTSVYKLPVKVNGTRTY
ncbi:MAG: SMP-30/gluconolactonase/LRE family protein [Acidobacteria bacterium]|nr:SMP-30/gluconolactonase/LRE family protein [Acidobacteriota bacterium]